MSRASKRPRKTRFCEQSAGVRRPLRCCPWCPCQRQQGLLNGVNAGIEMVPQIGAACSPFLGISGVPRHLLRWRCVLGEITSTQQSIATHSHDIPCFHHEHEVLARRLHAIAAPSRRIFLRFKSYPVSLSPFHSERLLLARFAPQGADEAPPDVKSTPQDPSAEHSSAAKLCIFDALLS